MVEPARIFSARYNLSHCATFQSVSASGSGASRSGLGGVELDAFPLGPADMTVSKGVLIVKDLTGGTTAISATYRYRGERTKRRMKLIGLDATLYSRTYAHGGAEMSWNLLTGDVLATKLKLVGSGENARYDKSAVKRFKRPVKTYYMEDTPGAEDTLDMATKGE